MSIFTAIGDGFKKLFGVSSDRVIPIITEELDTTLLPVEIPEEKIVRVNIILARVISKKIENRDLEKAIKNREPKESLTSKFSKEYYGRYITTRDLSPTRYTLHEGLCDELVWFNSDIEDHIVVLKELNTSKDFMLLKYQYIESEMPETSKLVSTIDTLTLMGGFPCRKVE